MNLSKNAIIKTLPKFKYNPNVYESDIVVFKSGMCQCCKKTVDAYLDIMYCEENINCICLNCVSDGSAAKKFDGTFINDSEKLNDKEKIEELYCRTPGYISWQGEYWLSCCNDFCEFIEHVGMEELENLNIVDDVFEEYKNKYDEDYINFIKTHLMSHGPIKGYLFKCRDCGRYRLHIDMN